MTRVRSCQRREIIHMMYIVISSISLRGTIVYTTIRDGLHSINEILIECKLINVTRVLSIIIILNHQIRGVYVYIYIL